MKYAFAILALGIAAPALAQQDLSKVEIKAEQLAPGVAVLFGAGGNIGVSYGEDGTVLVSSPQVSAPATVRYAWADNPEGANLYNAAGLPAAPFRTDK